MGELEVVAASSRPWTKEDITRMTRELGVMSSDTLIAHVRMSSMGWVCGSAQAVVEGLMDSVCDGGTLVMPAHSGANSDPAKWCNPPVPETWWEAIRESTPAFIPSVTPTRWIGAVAELFRTYPGVLRSDHPTGSFSAYGPHAGYITSGHALDFAFGDTSPLARLYELGGKVLLIGVGYENNTSMHLGEFRSGVMATERQGAAIMSGGRRVWAWYDELEGDSDRFGDIGAAYEAQGGSVAKGLICQAPSMLMPVREIVGFTADFIKRSRTKDSLC